MVSLAGAYYCCQRYTDAADAYSKSLAVFEMIEDAEKMAKCLINLANLHELQVTVCCQPVEVHCRLGACMSFAVREDPLAFKAVQT